MALDKFFCKVPETKATDKQIEFHSEREANEYCRDNDIDPHNVILMGDKYIIKTKDSDFRTTMDEAIKVCDLSPEVKRDIRRAIGFLMNAASVLGVEPEFYSIVGKIHNIVTELERM